MVNRKFTIVGKPKGKARPRFVRTGNYVRTYNPKSTTDYEDLVRESFKKQCGNVRMLLDSDIEVSMKIKAYFKPLKSMSKKMKQQLIGNEIGYMHKPDADNLAKIIADSLNGIAYKDDNQITKLEVLKLYGEEDKVEVEIKYL